MAYSFSKSQTKISRDNWISIFGLLVSMLSAFVGGILLAVT